MPAALLQVFVNCCVDTPLMTLRNSILLTRIKRHFSAAILARGADLFRKGHVGDIHRYEIDDGCFEYKAQIIGSSGNDYTTSVIFLESAIVSDCDCPYKGQQFKGQNAQDKAAWSLMDLLPTRHH